MFLPSMVEGRDKIEGLIKKFPSASENPTNHLRKFVLTLDSAGILWSGAKVEKIDKGIILCVYSTV